VVVTSADITMLVFFASAIVSNRLTSGCECLLARVEYDCAEREDMVGGVEKKYGREGKKNKNKKWNETKIYQQEGGIRQIVKYPLCPLDVVNVVLKYKNL
jgi:hypothetical protein